ncbi:hypothetical protein [Lacipirellula parvula]|uniref:Uncharacterized protein n=1 Tax=Lacipirellula parvula TaxID=2650471 RepID=A0A5K7XH41_9BACT|nr:hypothetical protein [Lacipirellula parvula]BBO35705.1 hypothetical protein PLANPX_5317 [Lacipirellula parvula]
MKTPHPDPTEAEIAELCEEIRRGWSPAEHRKRMAWAITDPVVVAEVEVDEPGE